MTKKLVTRYIEDNSIIGTKIRLNNDETLRGRNAANTSDVGILKVSGDDSVVIQSLFNTPAVKPTSNYQLTNKKYVDDKILSTSIAELKDVTISSPITGNVLAWNGSDWVNSKDQLSRLADVVISSPTNGQILKYNGTKWTNAANTAAFDYVVSFRILSAPSIYSRCFNSSMNFPTGIKCIAGSQDPTKKHRLGSSAWDMIISHDREAFCYDLKIMEYSEKGPNTTHYGTNVDLTAADVIRNNASDVGSGLISGKTAAFRIQDLYHRLNVHTVLVVVARFLG